ncbi:MAG: methyltransferase domain-containing protein [Leeuwenhoekiella sp.]
MRNLLKNIIDKERFKPGLLGIFINPYYFIRKGLYKGISAHKERLNGKLLDFGCGSKPYKNIIDVDEYIGLDIEQSGHDHSNEEIDVYWDGKKIPFPDATFDSILSSEVLEHVFEPTKTFKEINRVCKLNGVLLLTVPFVWNEHEIPYDYGRYSSYGLEYFLNKLGFEIIKAEKSTNYIETLFQSWNTYLFQVILKKNLLQMIFTPILIAPFTLMGIVFSFILPTDHSFYHNNIVLAKKVRSL